MTQRFLLAAVGCLLTELATSAAAGLFAPGTEALLMIGSALGLLLSALWFGRGLALALVGSFTSVSWGLVAAHLWSQHASALTPLPNGDLAGSVSGTTMFILATGCTALAALCGWMLFHAREPWPVVALFGSCLLLRADVSAIYADRFPLLAFGLFSLVGITLAGRAHVPARVALSAALALTAVAIAWQLPTSVPAWSQSFVDPLRNLGSRTVPVSGQTTLQLSGPFQPPNRPVMSIALSTGVSRPYWWTGVFDRYDGQSWHMTGYQILRAGAGSALESGRQRSSISPLTARVRVLEGTTNIVFPGSPLSASIPSLVLSQESDGTTLQVLANPSLASGAEYETRGDLSAPPPGSTSEEPPVGTYLQLPSVPYRVKQLTLALTPGGDALSKAVRLQRFLSASGRFTYNTQVGSPSYGDATDYFLFIARQGYCNQFATAMAVMLREAGIPSRIVSGFVGGALTGGRYVVKETDAHSWVQAFIPGRGWVDFEPTPGFALDPRMGATGGAHPVTQPGASSNPATSTVPLPQRTQLVAPPRPVPAVGPLHGRPSREPFPWLPVAIAGALLAVVLSVVRRPRSASAFYRRMARWGFRSAGPRPDETPHEFTERVFHRSAVHGHASTITDLYVLERYAGRTVAPSELARARAAWRVLRWRRPAPWRR